MLCEWEGKRGQCGREGPYTVQLLESDSAANIFITCWQHMKKYKSRKFVESVFGKGARVEIRRDVKPSRKFAMFLQPAIYREVRKRTPIVQDGVRLACTLFLQREKTDKPHRVQVVEV